MNWKDYRADVIERIAQALIAAGILIFLAYAGARLVELTVQTLTVQTLEAP